MKKLILLFIAATVAFGSIAAEEFRLSGRVKEATGKTDLTQARIILYDSLGNVRDSIQANQGLTYHYGQLDTMSYFSFIVPKVDSTHVFDVVCDGYLPETVSYRLDNIGRREQSRTIPTIYLERAPRLLKEVTVTTSKIKFYNKGDTVVYNADAFQLAEGSMLDALIAQLPGVELNSDGQIKVNGEFVESLLLNGKEFMDGNNNVMLENIAAYTVKDVQVYEGESAQAKRTNDKSAPKLLTMDVKLKKEYNMGWILNAQGGYGTEDRYTGRLFASWFNTTTRLTLVGNINNLNDNRQPGKNDTWTPEAMPTGTKEHRMAGFDYYYENPENTRQANGNLLFSQTINNSLRTLSRTNFLPGGDTYDNSFSDSRNSETGVQTRHSAYARFTNSAVGLSLGGSYANHKNANSDLSATFTEEQDGMTREILDALYSSGSPELLEKVINRSKTRTDGRSRQLNGYIFPYFTFKIPKTEDNIYVSLWCQTKNNNMRNSRTGSPPPEKWEVEDIIAHLSCDETTASEIMKECRSRHGIKDYGAIEKHLILDFINEKQRSEREREARYNADIATARQVAVLEEQVKTLQKICDSSSADARKARTQSLIANFISGISIAIAILALVLKLY